ncbi:major Facilitator Superfamily protein [Variibacter gotjawalensis]|uniref:Major Facilitator Superfamily protein n=1 Tax=Variibacter gotjawalensis TaxID=1333996 RepID=A0A0S3PSZ3_9BRAD|nr:MFS transporter [Variibacter gotjawalensis]NIK49381.1 putative MFS family arabinose efflux permease [Variibacter gotjawalensis]RZS51233.1 putative MFS family arabinose efflux permease [Variibacter gotjawalensis]BAT59066.1 major Facilitator Superfamily protein [Variibacter gotjawalensis]
MNSIQSLNGLNFFMADVRDGLGPFLGVFLQQKGWSPAEIGLVMTLGGYAGMIATTPLGALVDSTTAKRAIMVVASIAIIVASMITLFAPTFPVTVATQAVTGIAGAVVVPAIAGLTLGLVKQTGFAHQLGRNEAFNHAGNVFAAVAGGAAGYFFGLAAIFYFMAGMAFFAIIAVLTIKPEDIDHVAARGAAEKAEGDTSDTGQATSYAALLTNAPLIILAVTLMLFHLGNAAMLPLLGQALVARGAGDPSAFTAATVVVAQLTMIPMALLAARLAETRGYWIVFVLALASLPLRGVLAATISDSWGLIPVQMLDGVGAGLLGVATPGLTARILKGTGNVNVGLGAVMTMQGVGAATSPAFAGFIAERVNYATAFFALAAIAALALILWIGATRIVGPACGGAAKAAPAAA